MYGIIYCVTNTANGKQYVGQTVSKLKRRWRQHLWFAEKGYKTSLYLAIRKYGQDFFSVTKIDSGNSVLELNEKEVFYIRDLNTLSPSGYNLTTGGEGFKLSEETKEKISIGGRGKTLSQETREKISLANKGKVIPQEAREKMSFAHRGKVASQETRKRMSDSQQRISCRRGHIHNKETTFYIKNTNNKRCLICYYLSLAKRGISVPVRFREYLKEFYPCPK